MKKNHFLIAFFLVFFVAGNVAVFARTSAMKEFFDSVAAEFTGSPAPHTLAAAGTIEVAFSPNNGATAIVVKALEEAKESILVQAYSFTSAPIAKALVDAKTRGVDVKVILDKSQLQERYTSATFIANHDIPVRIDMQHAIAHNKVIIYDEQNVITGSFNFTRAAEERNAENVLVLRANPELAKLYSQNWRAHWGHSKEYQRGG